MNDIVNRMRLGQGASTSVPPAQRAPVSEPAQNNSLRVTLDDLGHPAYMINHNFELVWINGAAQQALFGGFIQHADGLHHGFLRGGGLRVESDAGGVDGGAGGPAEGAVANAFLFVLTIAFDLRLNVSQGFTPELQFL